MRMFQIIFFFFCFLTRVSQKFCNILVTWGTIRQLQDASAKFMKMTNHTDKLAWYSQGATCQICFYDLEQDLSIYAFMPIWPS